MAGRGIGHFKSVAARAHYRSVYDAGMAQLPDHSAHFDVPTTFGTVRVYRFDGPAGTPVLLLPGRNASTPMWRTNLPGLLTHRTVYTVDLLGEAGMSVQHVPIAGPEDQACWLDETLAGLSLDRAHLAGASIGGWTATNCAVWRPGRVASLTLLDPVFTFAPIPVRTMLISAGMYLPFLPEWVRRRVLSWISGGADIEAAGTESALIAAGADDFVLSSPMPKLFTDAALAGLDIPVLALIAGRSVMLDPDHAVSRARNLLRHGEVELWRDASHAINGEYPDEVAARAGAFWVEVEDD